MFSKSFKIQRLFGIFISLTKCVYTFLPVPFAHTKAKIRSPLFIAICTSSKFTMLKVTNVHLSREMLEMKNDLVDINDIYHGKLEQMCLGCTEGLTPFFVHFLI